MKPASSVLIIDRSDEARVVLRTALERRGLRVLEARRAEAGLAIVRRHRPEVIVLDLEVGAAAAQAAGDFAEAAENAGGMLVLLGTASFSAADCDEFVAKPYHYQPLILKIEELLRERHGRAAA